MNGLDLVVLAVGLGAAVGGWRLGFVARVLAWAGVVVALSIGVRYVPRAVTSFGGTTAESRATVAVVFLVLLAAVGQSIGLALGALIHLAVPMTRPLPRWDRAAGAVIGAAGVLVLLWMIIPSLATARGWPARLARSSVIVKAIQQYAPKQPTRFAAWGRAISDAPYPSALGTLQSPPNPGPPPLTAMSAAVDARARASTVKVVGRACDQIQEGTGWVAAPGIVVTNAHVVAGEQATQVQTSSGATLPATVVAFDPVRDVALLDVPSITARALPTAPGAVGDVGAVYGHPGGGALEAAPARVGDEILAVGTDIYRTGSSRRHVYVLAARLAPGDSGGALVDRRGDVIGMAFAIDPGRGDTAYALTDAEILPLLQAVSSDRAAVGTGRCLVG